MTNRVQPVTVKKRQDDVNAEWNSKSPIVQHVRLDTLVIPIAVHANVISTVRKVTIVNHRMVYARANQTMPAIFVNDALKDSMDQIVYHAIAI